MRKAAVKHPIAASVIIIFLFFIIMQFSAVLLLFSPEFFRSNGQIIQQFTCETVMALGAVLLAAILGYISKFYSTEKFWTGIGCSAYFIILYSFAAIGNLITVLSQSNGTGVSFLPISRIVFLPLCTFAIGFTEETIFRGIISNLFWDKHAKDPAGVWTATLYSGLMFGLMHSINLLGADPAGVLTQIVNTAAAGVALTAIYYRCKNLWVMILLHGFMDFCGLLNVGLFGGSTITDEIGSYSMLSFTVSTLIFIFIALILLRKKKIIEILTPNGAFGYIPPQQPGQILVGVNMPSSQESKKSLKRAIIVFVVIMLALYAIGIFLDPMVKEMINEITGSYVVDYDDTGKWMSGTEPTIGHDLKFEIEEAGVYEVSLITQPSSSKADMVMQIVNEGEIIFQASYGGKCTTTFEVELPEGESELRIVYSFASVTDSSCEYSTRVRIKR